MSTATARKAAKRARRPIYGTFERVAVVETGEERLAILASHPIDARLLKERGYRRGDEVRLEILKPRNPKFHRLAHQIGTMLVDNALHSHGFDGKSSHDAIKRVQTLAGVCCEEQLIDMGSIKFGDIEVPVGEVPVKVPRSIAFDEMDDTEFSEFFNGVTKYIDEHFAPDWAPEARADYFTAIQGNQQ